MIVSQMCANNSIFNNNLSYNLNENFIINDYQVFTKSKGFRILHFNSQSIVQKIDEFRNFLYSYKIFLYFDTDFNKKYMYSWVISHKLNFKNFDNFTITRVYLIYL
jgi:hypothetical protein